MTASSVLTFLDSSVWRSNFNKNPRKTYRQDSIADWSTASEPWRVVVQDTIAIPACHEMTVPDSKYGGTTRCTLIDVKPACAARSDIVVARTLADSSCDQLPMRVATPLQSHSPRHYPIDDTHRDPVVTVQACRHA